MPDGEEVDAAEEEEEHLCSMSSSDRLKWAMKRRCSDVVSGEE